MQLGPAGSPRPDVYTLPKAYSRFTPIAYECKVSVSDFRRDVTAGKWQSYLQFAAGVIFAVPAGLIKKEDVPPGCGLMVRHDAVWRAVKGPTLHHIGTLPHEAWMKLMIDGLSRDVFAKEVRARELNPYAVNAKIRAKYGERLAKVLSDLSTAEYWLAEEIKKTHRSIEELEQEERERMKRAREAVEREVEGAKQTMRELAVALGLPAEAPLYEIRSAARAAALRLSQDGEIDRMREKLKRVQDALAEGLQELPAIARAA